MKIQRIGWKIFFAFWMANLLVVAITSFILLVSIEGEKFREKQRMFITEAAGRIIEFFEGKGDISEESVNNFFAENLMLREILAERLLRIYNRQGNKIFENPIEEANPSSFNRFEITHAGSVYSIETIIGPPPNFVRQSLRTIQVFHLATVLLVSAIVSFFLSWTITRPLKQLGSFSRQYARGEHDATVPGELLKRGDEVGDLSRDFEMMRATVEETLQYQKQLLHDVSHELRAPLARLQVTVGLIEQKRKVGPDLARLHEECERIDALIQRILDYARTEQHLLKKEPTDILAFIQKQIDHMRVEFPERQIQRLPDGHSNLAERSIIPLSRELLERALCNVLRNACKHTPQSCPIDIRVSLDQRNLTVEVRDHGEGVKQEELVQLSTPFYRAGNAMHSEGHGLGLSIARRAMERHDGDLTLRNHPDGGLVVSLCCAV